MRALPRFTPVTRLDLVASPERARFDAFDLALRLRRDARVDVIVGDFEPWEAPQGIFTELVAAAAARDLVIEVHGTIHASQAWCAALADGAAELLAASRGRR